MTTGWVIKARLEEQFLRDQIGEIDGEYVRRAPMLVPRRGGDDADKRSRLGS